MKEMLLAAIFALIPGATFILHSRSNSELYYDYSRQQLASCLDYSKTANLAISTCSNIRYAADAAYSSAMSGMTTLVVGLVVAVYFLTWWTLLTRKQLSELKARLDA